MKSDGRSQPHIRILLAETGQVYVTRDREFGVVFSRTGHSIEVLGFDLGEPHPPRRARTFVGQTAGCRTKTQLAPVRRRVQFRHSQRTIPLPEKASPKRKITGGFSAAILRGSSGIKKRGCRPCKASGGHSEPIFQNRITLRADGFKPTHDSMDIRLKRNFSK